MTAPDTDLERNARATARLRALVAALPPEALATPLGGWTVQVALGHLAFWEARQRAALERHLAGAALGDGAPPALEDSDAVVNDAVDALARRLDAAAAGALAVEAAEAMDALLERAPRDVVAGLAAGPQASIVRRWRHREEHLDQIAPALTPDARPPS